MELYFHFHYMYIHVCIHGAAYIYAHIDHTRCKSQLSSSLTKTCIYIAQITPSAASRFLEFDKHKHVYPSILLRGFRFTTHTILSYARVYLRLNNVVTLYSKWYLWLVYLMYEERLINWLPRIRSHELLEPCVAWSEKWIDVSFISMLCSVCEF